MTATNGISYLRERWDALRESYWFLPSLMATLSGVLALVAVQIDEQISPEWIRESAWFDPVSAAGARSVLSTIAGSMITVTGVVFSIMVVALTLTSSQFGPRLLRTFLRDRRSQVVLGTFVSTFIYSLLVLQAVESPERVPVLAALGSVVLVVTSLFVLIYYVHHAASSLQVSSVIASVAREIEEQIGLLLPEEGAEAESGASDGEPPVRDADERSVIRSSCEGYVRFIDADALFVLACAEKLVVRAHARPGAFVTCGGRLAEVTSGGPIDEGVRGPLREAFLLGDHRTAVQDLGFLIDQLVEMAVRALSPGINDPETAIACVHRLGGALARIAPRPMPASRRYDDGGALRVELEPLRFEEIAAGCFDAIRVYGGGHASVVTALLEAIVTGAENCTSPERRAVLAEHAREIHQAFLASEPDSPRDRRAVETAFASALEAL